jgi:hypothetical protein
VIPAKLERVILPPLLTKQSYHKERTCSEAIIHGALRPGWYRISPLMA